MHKTAENSSPCKLLPMQKNARTGGTVAQAVAPTTFGLEAHGGHGFESGPMSFLLSTPQLFSLSFPVPLLTALSIKGTKSPKIKKRLIRQSAKYINMHLWLLAQTSGAAY